jgi:crossover junction endodeoxyribonuclease RuvC
MRGDRCSSYHSAYGPPQQVRLRATPVARYSSKSWRAFRPRAALDGTPSASATLTAARAERCRTAPVTVAAITDCRILGLDPGSQRTGFGVIDCLARGERYVASGCINVTGAELVVRLQRIDAAVRALIAEHRPHMVAIERVFVHRNPDSALKLGHARGVALCAAAALGASVHEYAPRAIKLAITGYGAAPKPQVAHMVRTLLALSLSLPLMADAADALAAALCHAHQRRLDALGAAHVA